MLKISVFTPTHKLTYILDAYRSLKSQSYSEWEWVLLLNNGVDLESLPREIREDERVKTFVVEKVAGVGEAKKICCEFSSGEILVELDHDDILLPECLMEIAEAFDKHPSAALVYSNSAGIDKDGKPTRTEWSAQYGWQYRDTEIDGVIYHETISFEPHPHNVSLIWFAPNHVRAFRRDAYFTAGGYNPTMQVLDDQDLMCRLYLQGEFVHVNKLLYLQRDHAEQTQKDKDLNAFIQIQTLELHGQYITDLARVWAERQGLKAIDMGAAHRKKEGFLAVDIDDMPGVDIVADAMERLPFEDGSVGVIRAVDFMEHIPDKIHLIKEFYRVLAHGGMLLSMTPSSEGRGAFQDPTHVAYYNDNSFWYYTHKIYRDFIHGLEVRFQESRVWTDFPSEWHRINQIPYVHGHIIALKQESRDFGGLLFI